MSLIQLSEQSLENLDLPNLIYRLRMNHGLSQMDVAALLNVVAETDTVTRLEISRWERGIRQRGAYWLSHLAVVLNVPLFTLSAARRSAKKRTRPNYIDRITPQAIEAVRAVVDQWREQNKYKLMGFLTEEQVDELRALCWDTMTNTAIKLLQEAQANHRAWMQYMEDGVTRLRGPIRQMRAYCQSQVQGALDLYPVHQDQEGNHKLMADFDLDESKHHALGKCRCIIGQQALSTVRRNCVVALETIAEKSGFNRGYLAAVERGDKDLCIGGDVIRAYEQGAATSFDEELLSILHAYLMVTTSALNNYTSLYYARKEGLL